MSPLNANNLLTIQGAIDQLKIGNEHTVRTIVYNDYRREDLTDKVKEYLEHALRYIETFEMHNEIVTELTPTARVSLDESINETLSLLKDKLSIAISSLE